MDATDPRTKSLQKARAALHAKQHPEMLERREKFLKAYALHGTIMDGCKAAGVQRWAVRDWVNTDVLFAERYEQAKEDAIEVLEHECRLRALGKAPVRKGFVKASDTCLIFLLKAARPELYRERANDGWGTDDELIRRGKEALDRIDQRRSRIAGAGREPVDPGTPSTGDES